MQAASINLADFLAQQHLPAGYADLVGRWFLPLADELANHRHKAGHPLLLGINGSQGSGKSTLAALLRFLFETRLELSAIDLSIDDFYLPREQRQDLARRVHPLLATRGVPGTHDIPLLRDTLSALLHGEGEIPVPRFDKARDERVPRADWQTITVPVDIVILEGWCLGTPPQTKDELATPVNLLEANEDANGHWRNFVNRQIANHYQPLYQLVDAWLMLKAPSFDCVYQWRLEQERKLARQVQGTGTENHIMSPIELARFIEHYQRLTTHTLYSLPGQVHYLFQLDAARRIDKVSRPQRLKLS